MLCGACRQVIHWCLLISRSTYAWRGTLNHLNFHVLVKTCGQINTQKLAFLEYREPFTERSHGDFKTNSLWVSNNFFLLHDLRACAKTSCTGISGQSSLPLQLRAIC